MLKTIGQKKCACGSAWCCVSIRAEGLRFLCGPCWRQIYFRDRSIPLDTSVNVGA